MRIFDKDVPENVATIYEEIRKKINCSVKIELTNKESSCIKKNKKLLYS